MRRRSFLRGLLGMTVAPVMLIAAAEKAARFAAAEKARRKLISNIVDVQPMTVKTAGVFFLEPGVHEFERDVILVPTNDRRLQLRRTKGYAGTRINPAYYRQERITV